MEVDKPDFHATNDANNKVWTVTWKWMDDSEPDTLQNTVTEYAVSLNAKAEYEAEIKE